MAEKNIQLSICIPAYNRPEGLKRALNSIVKQQGIDVETCEIIISDDSTIPTCQQVTKEILEDWHGKWEYIKNSPRLGMAENWNQSIKIASGEYILVLHDDDYLEQNGIYSIFKEIQESLVDKKVLLFGVNIVDSNQKILRKQSFRQAKYLSPKQATKAILSNSSFVRFPGIVISNTIFTTNSYFNTTIGEVADLEMWSRLFKEYGVWCIPHTTAAYTVHSNALTMKMFNSDSISKIDYLFNNINSNKHYFSENEINKLKSSFFHQFILAGTFRNMRRGRWEEAHKIMLLFKQRLVSKLPICIKWYGVRQIFHYLIYFQMFLSRKV